MAKVKIVFDRGRRKPAPPFTRWFETLDETKRAIVIDILRRKAAGAGRRDNWQV